MAPARLRCIAAGHPPTPAELVDITFAELATTVKRDTRRTKRVRAQRYCMHCMVVLIAVLVALGVLMGLGLAFFALAAHSF